MQVLEEDVLSEIENLSTLVIPNYIFTIMVKALKIVVFAARILSVFGIGVGVLFIILSYRFNSIYEDFKENGTLVYGVITNLYDNDNVRYTSYLVDVDYSRLDSKGQEYAVKAERIEVYFQNLLH